MLALAVGLGLVLVLAAVVTNLAYHCDSHFRCYCSGIYRRTKVVHLGNSDTFYNFTCMSATALKPNPGT